MCVVIFTEDGRSTTVFSLYWQLSQGRMADFPAFIASKSFDLWNHHIPQMKWHNLRQILMYKKYTYMIMLKMCFSVNQMMIYRVVIKSSHGPSDFLWKLYNLNLCIVQPQNSLGSEVLLARKLMVAAFLSASMAWSYCETWDYRRHRHWEPVW